MRRQDELIAVYGGQDLMARKFVLAQLVEFSQTFDAEDTLGFFQQRLGDDEAPIRDQTLLGLTRFLPGFIQKRHALVAPSIGTWSVVRTRNQLAAEARARSPGSSRAVARRRTAAAVLAEPLARALVTTLDHADPAVGRMARIALCHMRVPAAELALKVRAQQGNFLDLLCAAIVSGPEAADAALAPVLIEAAERDPDALLLVACLPGKSALARAAELAPRTNTLGRVNLAIALSAGGAQAGALPVEPLLEAREVWTVVHLLDAMRVGGRAESMDLVERVYGATGNAFVRAHAVRAASGLPTPRALELARRAVADPAPSVQAEALEALIRGGAAPDVVRSSARPLLASTSLRTRVNAILAIAELPEDRTPPGVDALLLGNAPVERLEAAYCLGYLQNQPGLAALIALATLDPSTPVRIQAAKSLSKYPVGAVAVALVELISSSAGPVALAAARGVMRYQGDEALVALEVVSRALGRSQAGSGRGLLYRAGGMLAHRCGQPRAAACLAAGLDDAAPQVRAGAVEGFSLLGQGLEEVDRRKLGDLLRTADGPLSARAALALLTNGETESLAMLADLLRRTDGATLIAGLETALEVALLLFHVPLMDRFRLLEERLDACVPAIPEESQSVPAMLELAGAAAPETDPVRETEEFAVLRPRKVLLPVGKRGQDAEEKLKSMLAALPRNAESGPSLETHDLDELAPWRKEARHDLHATTGEFMPRIQAEARSMPQSDAPISAPRSLVPAPRSLVPAPRSLVPAPRAAVSRPVTQPASPAPDAAPPRGVLSVRIAAAALGVLCLALVARSGTPRGSTSVAAGSPAAGARPALRVDFLQGNVALEPRAAPLATGSTVVPGATLTTSSYSSAGLVTSAGCTVTLGPTSTLQCGSCPPDGRSGVFAFAGRSVELDFRKGRAVEVSLPHHVVKSGAARFAIDEVEGRLRVHALKGKVEVVAAGADSRTVDEGQDRLLD